MAVVFLLGSGISLNAGIPSVGTISEQIFSGDGVIRHSDATYYLADPGGSNYDDYRTRAEPAIRFVQRLRGLADRYFAEVLDERSANYEDVANLAKQIADAISGEYENPALLPLLAELKDGAGSLAELMELATEAHNYSRDMVWRMLDRSVDHAYEIRHLTAIIDGCRALRSADLFELNHDRVVESALAQAGIAVSDGFTRPNGDVVFWTGEFEAPVRCFKLHGSVSWFHRNVPDERCRGLVVARSSTNDPYHEHGGGGELLALPADGRPVLLAGTFDKPLSYDSTLFADQHYRFHESLRQADALVVIGYGFRDKAINSRLIGWMHGGRDRRLVVVHGEPASLVAEARGAIRRQSGAWISEGRMCVIEKGIADVTWEEIAEAMGR
jgi:SIR2-like domain